MITLKIIGTKSSAFPNELNMKELKKIWIGGHSDLSYVLENIELAQKYNKPEIAKALKKATLRYKLRNVKDRIAKWLQ